MDRYDEAIAHLNRFPEELAFAEEFPSDHRIAGCLFVNAAQNLFSYLKTENGKFLGSPTRIKTWPDHFTSGEASITLRILNDNSIPTVSKCRLEHLPVLAEYQRYFDRIWNRRFPAVGIVEDSSDKETSETPVEEESVLDGAVEQDGQVQPSGETSQEIIHNED